MSKVTLEDVAKYAGVGRATVDRVIHERGNVKPAVEKKVREALNELGYEKNVIASALAYKKYARKLAVIYPRISSEFFNEKIITGIKNAENELRDFGIDIEYVSVDRNNPKQYCDEIDRMKTAGFHGFSICAPDQIEIKEKIKSLVENGMPVVLFNTDISDCNRECFVGENLVQSGKIAGNIMSRMLRDDEAVIVGFEQSDKNASSTRVTGFISEIMKNNVSEKNIFYLNTIQNEDQIKEQLKEYFDQYHNIRGIYLASEPNWLIGEFLNSQKITPRPYVICHDIDPTTIKYLQLDIFDYVIDQDVTSQSFRSLLILKDILLNGKWDMDVTTETNIYNSVYFENIDE